jgi:hypothetical protein
MGAHQAEHTLYGRDTFVFAAEAGALARLQKVHQYLANQPKRYKLELTLRPAAVSE